MHAIERLRYVARAGEIDATELACEAAYALAGLSRDRRALVLACRRLLEFHPHCGPLWWVTAHCLVADDLRSTAASLVERLETDGTVDELFALPQSQAVVVSEATRTVVRGLCERSDLSVRLVGDHYGLRSSMRFFSDAFVPAQGFDVDEIDQALGDTDVVIVEALAAAPSGYLLSTAGRALAECARANGQELWVVAGVGRVLPGELFDVLVSPCLSDKDHIPSGRLSDAARAGIVETEDIDVATTHNYAHPALVPVDAASLVITASGPRPPKVVFHKNPSVSHQRCPVPTELLVPFGVAG